MCRATSFVVILMTMGVAFVLTPTVLATPIPLPDGTPEPGNRELFVYLRHDLAAGGPVPVQVAGNNFLIDIPASQAARAIRGGVSTFALGTIEIDGRPVHPVFDLVMEQSPIGPFFRMTEPWEFALAANDRNVVLANSVTTTTFITDFAVGGQLRDVPGVRLIAGKGAADISGDVTDFPSTGYFTDWADGLQQFDAVIDVVPEPSTLAMLVCVLLAVTCHWRRRSR